MKRKIRGNKLRRKHGFVSRLGTISEGFLTNYSPEESSSVSVDKNTIDMKKCIKSVKNNSTDVDASVVEGIKHLTVNTSEELSITKRTNKTGFQTSPLVEKDSTISDNLSREDGEEEEILTPYQATKHIKIKPPSYWVGCSYTHRPLSQRLDLTIRQTGVLPEVTKRNGFSKLTVNVHLRTSKKKMKQTATLLKSARDKSFRSRSISFKENMSRLKRKGEKCVSRSLIRIHIVRYQTKQMLQNICEQHGSVQVANALCWFSRVTVHICTLKEARKLAIPRHKVKR